MQNDVLRFALHHHHEFSKAGMADMHARLNASFALHGAIIGAEPVIERHVLLFSGQWILVKGGAEGRA